MLSDCIRPRKRFGQHFLHDPATLQRIVQVLQLESKEAWVEIGPGLGALTKKLLPLVSKLDVIELDRDLIPELKSRCAALGLLQVHAADALQFDFSTLKPPDRSMRLVGNLPYNIATPLLFHLMRYRTQIQDIYVMLQKEVADRLIATPGQKAYGRLSVMMQYHCQIQRLFTVRPGSFWPPPKVASAFVKLIPYSPLPCAAHQFVRFAELVRRAFSHRRKTLQNNLRGWVDAQQMAECQINPQSRPDGLTVLDYVQLERYLTEALLPSDSNKVSYS